MHIAFVTAGGAGMFCGSCMQDNALSRALMREGSEVSLLPTYTPIRVDGESMAQSRVFLGGINLYLDHKVPGWRYLPRFLVSWLDHPSIIRWATSWGIENDGSKLGGMTLDMLSGSHGSMRREYQELVDYLVHLKPDVILFTNALLSGVLPLLRERYSGPVACLLQGDDLFLEALGLKYREQALAAISENGQLFDQFLCHSHLYADHISHYLRVPRERFSLLPLAIDPDIEAVLPRNPLEVTTQQHLAPAEQRTEASVRLPHRIGYFARIAPEKGLLQLVQTVKLLRQQGLDVELHAGGYLGKSHLRYMRNIEEEARELGDRFRYIGSPADAAGKYAFLKSLDLLSVPVMFPEPKGLYALEAISMGIPVVLPRRGSLTELVEGTGGGLLYDPDSPEDHARALRELLEHPADRVRYALAGQSAVLERHTTTQAARTLLQIAANLLNTQAQQK